MCKARERYHGKRHSLAYGLEVAKAQPKEEPRKEQQGSAVGLGKKRESHGSQAENGHKEHVYPRIRIG